MNQLYSIIQKKIALNHKVKSYSFICKLLYISFLFIQSKSHVYGASHCAAYHRIVTYTEEAHHLNVCRNGTGACELSVAVHTAHRIGHTVRSARD